MEVDRGCTVDLSVIIAGFPIPQITWTLDDDVISETNQRFIFKQDDTQNKYSLIITHITRQQEGVYRCVAKNCQGSCSTMGFITVKGTLLLVQVVLHKALKNLFTFIAYKYCNIIHIIRMSF